MRVSKTLVTVFHQQCEVVENKENTPCEIVIREKPLGDEIISSPHNTDARYVRKGKQSVCGQKGFLTETCDKTNQTQFITDVEVTPATTSDVKELPVIQKRLEESCMRPAGTIYRCRICEWSDHFGLAREKHIAGRTEFRAFPIFREISSRRPTVRHSRFRNQNRRRQQGGNRTCLS